MDGKNGEGSPGGKCSSCPYNQFGSADDGSGKACKNMHRVYILRSGELIPILLTLPPTSIKAFADYLGKRVVSKGKRSYGVLTLDPHRADITGISLSISPGTGIYIPLLHQVGKNAEDIGGIMLFLSKEIFQNRQMIKVAHNLGFEAMFLYKHGVVVLPPVYDTIAAAQLTLKEEMGFRELKDCGLKTLVPALFNVELPTYSEVTEGRYFDELHPEDDETVRYACADSNLLFGCITGLTSGLTGFFQSIASYVKKSKVPPQFIPAS